jgi:hypothetical protein
MRKRKMENKIEDILAMPSVACQICQIGSEGISDTVGVAHDSIAIETTEIQTTTEIVVVDLQGMPDVRLNEKVAAAIPNLALLEYASLEYDIVKNGGCSESVKVWQNPEDNNLYLLDGFARVRICKEHGLPMPSGELISGFPDLETAVQWRIDQHLARRNLNPWWHSYLWGSKYNSDKLPAHRPYEQPQNAGVTAQKFAELAGVSTDTIQRDAGFAKAIDILKANINPQFGLDLLNKKFKLSKTDIRKLANMPEAERKAIAEVLISNPDRSLSQAEEIIYPANTETTNGAEPNSQDLCCQDSSGVVTVDVTTDAPEDDAAKSNIETKHKDPDELLEQCKNRLLGIWATLQSIDRVQHPERVDNIIHTSEEITTVLGELKARSSS